jgi:hypothetical protein
MLLAVYEKGHRHLGLSFVRDWSRHLGGTPPEVNPAPPPPTASDPDALKARAKKMAEERVRKGRANSIYAGNDANGLGTGASGTAPAKPTLGA